MESKNSKDIKNVNKSHTVNSFNTELENNEITNTKNNRNSIQTFSCPSYNFKFVLVGDINVGKTCIKYQFTEGKFDNNYKSTVGVEFKIELLLDHGIIVLHRCRSINIPGFKISPDLVGLGHHILVPGPENGCQYQSANEVWRQETAETHPAAEDGDHFGTAGHFGGKKDDRNEYEQGEKHGIDPGNETDVIVHDDLGYR